MFESWSETLGGILSYAAIPGFLANLNDFYESADDEGASWRSFLLAWFETHGTGEKLTADLWSLAAGLLPLGDKSEQSQKIKLGILLNEKRERVFDINESDAGRIRIVKAGTRNRAQQWQLEQVR